MPLMLAVILTTIVTFGSDAFQIDYTIINDSKTKSRRTYTENDLYHALRLLLIHKNNGYIANSSNGIKIYVWDKYYASPMTIHPMYAIRLEKISTTY